MKRKLRNRNPRKRKLRKGELMKRKLRKHKLRKREPSHIHAWRTRNSVTFDPDKEEFAILHPNYANGIQASRTTH